MARGAGQERGSWAMPPQCEQRNKKTVRTSALSELVLPRLSSDRFGDLALNTQPHPPTWILLALPPFLPAATRLRMLSFAVLRWPRSSQSACRHFGPSSPCAWLPQVEAHFQLRCIASQETKFLHFVSSLPPDVAEELVDIISLPDTARPFDMLKAAIINYKSVSECSKLQQLLSATELGDSRPSKLLHHIRQLLGDSAAQHDTLL
ncbi:uncharacterized protein LOC144114938 [Amblyomma americanum]